MWWCLLFFFLVFCRPHIPTLLWFLLKGVRNHILYLKYGFLHKGVNILAINRYCHILVSQAYCCLLFTAAVAINHFLIRAFKLSKHCLKALCGENYYSWNEDVFVLCLADKCRLSVVFERNYLLCCLVSTLQRTSLVGVTCTLLLWRHSWMIRHCEKYRVTLMLNFSWRLFFMYNLIKLILFALYFAKYLFAQIFV